VSTTTTHDQPTGAAAGLAPVIPIGARALHPAGGGRLHTDGGGPGHLARRAEAARPDPARLAGLLVRFAAEVAAGRRPLRQLEPLLAPALVRRLAAGLRPGLPRPQEELHVRRVVAGTPTPSGAVEATVLVERAGRVTAVAVRLERHLGAWRATELTAPEAGYAPLPTRSDPRARRGPDAFDEAAAEAAAALSRDRDSA
jgi:hypothetical protein